MMATTEGKMMLTITCSPRRWWRIAGLPGTFLVWVGLKCRLPFGWFFRLSID